MNNVSSVATISILRSTFARFGLPKLIVTDQGRQFQSNKFEEFLNKNNIKHIDVPAYHQSSNGQAESSVKIVKNHLKKVLNSATSNDTLLARFLFDYRNSVDTTTGVKPSELMFRHKINDRFSSILPTISSSEKVVRKQAEQKYYYKGKRNLEFSPGDKVLIKSYKHNKEFWEKGNIKGKIEKVVYEVYINGKKYCIKKHVDQLKLDYLDNTS